MDDVFLGEIRLVGFTFAPEGWAFCNGQLLSVAQNSALFSLLGTTYGGNGVTTFAVPDLRSRVPIHQGNNYARGGFGGAETVTLTSNNLPSHNHPAAGVAAGTTGAPGGNTWAGSVSLKQYAGAGTGNETLAGASIGATGGGQPHDNIIPYLALNYIIAVEGQYPTSASSARPGDRRPVPSATRPRRPGAGGN